VRKATTFWKLRHPETRLAPASYGLEYLLIATVLVFYP